MTGKRLTTELIAMRAVKELQDGDLVNVGLGIPSLLSSFIPENTTIFFHSESGVVGFGRALTADERDLWDFDFVNATGQFLTPLPGMCFMDTCSAFGMVRGHHVDVTVLGALQVSQAGDLANWIAGDEALLRDEGRIGGAMDMAYGAKRVIVTMRHNDPDGGPKILPHCSYLVTRRKCVDLLITDLAVIRVTPPGLRLEEVAPGWTAAEVQAQTGCELIVADDLVEMAP